MQTGPLHVLVPALVAKVLARRTLAARVIVLVPFPVPARGRDGSQGERGGRADVGQADANEVVRHGPQALMTRVQARANKQPAITAIVVASLSLSWVGRLSGERCGAKRRLHTEAGSFVSDCYQLVRIHHIFANGPQR